MRLPAKHSAPALAGACVATGFALASASALASPSVTSCADDGSSGTLRSVISAPTTVDGDVVDLSQVPLSCSAISLGTGAITISQNNLTLADYTVRPSQLKIVPCKPTRVFYHSGTGTLAINHLAIENGYYLGTSTAYGGCIRSAGSVHLTGSTLANCKARAVTTSSSIAKGAGIYAHGSVGLYSSSVTGCEARADSTENAFGGGVFAHGAVTAQYTTISGNKADVAGPFGAQGGGLYAGNGIQISNSVIVGNYAGFGGGVVFSGAPSVIANSTISGNTAGEAAIVAFAPLTLRNSTVAFNHANSSFAGLYFGGVYIDNTSLTLQSSILAHNTNGSGNKPSDLSVSAGGSSSVAGANNLVMATDGKAPPAGVIATAADPKLGPLQLNGGQTQTHALLPGSPAIGTGNDAGGLMTDQRGIGYPRTSTIGTSVKTDIGAFQFDSIFYGGFEP